MAQTLVERQTDFRGKRKAQGGMRLDMWLAGEEADKLRKLIAWRGQKSGPQVVLGLINEMWITEVKKAAHAGHAEAQFEYAKMMLLSGKNAKAYNASAKASKTWFKESINQRYRVGAASNNLGVLSEKSHDFQEAIKWFQISTAQAQGNRCAYYNLGVLYTLGRGITKDDCQAAESFQKSADLELKAAQQYLGVLYVLGKGVPKDDEKALEWLRRGVGEDDIACQNFLVRVFSTFPDDAFGLRDGHLAIALAEKLAQPRRSSEYLETLAAAYAEAGRFEDARNTQLELLQRVKEQKPLSQYRREAIKHCQDRFRSYLLKMPWRDDSLSIELLFED